MNNDTTQLSIFVNQNGLYPGGWWANIWESHGFSSWSDASGWLYEQNAVANRSSRDRFKIVFHTTEDLVKFKLTWMYKQHFVILDDAADWLAVNYNATLITTPFYTRYIKFRNKEDMVLFKLRHM